jgi:hypothetical protein
VWQSFETPASLSQGRRLRMRSERKSRRSAWPACLAIAQGTTLRPYSLRPRVSRIPFRFHAAAKQNARARGTPKVPKDTRTSTPRDIEACRSLIVPQVRQTQGVPRAVFLGLLRIAPGGLTFQAPPLSKVRRLSTARGARTASGTSDRVKRRRQFGPLWRAVGAPGRSGLDRRRGNLAPHLRRFPRPPLPAPRLETLIRHPSLSGRDETDYSLTSTRRPIVL